MVCYNDEIADRFVRYLLRIGRKIPDEVAVVSFDNSYYSDLCPVRITSLAHEVGKLGRIAAQLLLDYIGSQALSVSIHLLAAHAEGERLK